MPNDTAVGNPARQAKANNKYVILAVKNADERSLTFMINIATSDYCVALSAN